MCPGHCRRSHRRRRTCLTWEACGGGVSTYGRRSHKSGPRIKNTTGPGNGMYVCVHVRVHVRVRVRVRVHVHVRADPHVIVCIDVPSCRGRDPNAAVTDVPNTISVLVNLSWVVGARAPAGSQSHSKENTAHGRVQGGPGKVTRGKQALPGVLTYVSHTLPTLSPSVSTCAHRVTHQVACKPCCVFHNGT